MEKPADRTEQARPAGVACRSYLDQLTSIRFTHEHERWALTMASTVVRWRWSCVRALVFLSVCKCWACPKPSVQQAEGIGQHPQRSTGNRQAGSMSPIAMRQRGFHATPHQKMQQTRTQHATCIYFTPTI